MNPVQLELSGVFRQPSWVGRYEDYSVSRKAYVLAYDQKGFTA